MQLVVSFFLDSRLLSYNVLHPPGVCLAYLETTTVLTPMSLNEYASLCVLDDCSRLKIGHILHINLSCKLGRGRAI
jgi:hypothetical protein